MRAASVDRALCICTTLDEFERVHALALDNDGFWCSAGVHPDEEDSREPTVEGLVALTRARQGRRDRRDRARLLPPGRARRWPRWSGSASASASTSARRAPAAGRWSSTPRSASADTLRLIREEEGGEAGGVFHCFTETAEVARAALDLGFHISFSGILTFKNASDLREVAAFVPLDRCLIETDSPYLAPMPFRGKVNTPANVPLGRASAGRDQGPCRSRRSPRRLRATSSASS